MRSKAVQEALRQQPREPVRTADPQTFQIQQLLNQRGFSAGKPDGVSGKGTRAAISAFQHSIGQPVTGVLTPDQLSILKSGSTQRSVTKIERESSLDVREVQKLLTELGYEPGTVDGVWGRQSQAALNQFRTDLGANPGAQPTADDFALMQRELDTSETPPVLPIFNLPAKTIEPAPTASLVALSAVDRGKVFHVVWAAEGLQSAGLSVVPVIADLSAMSVDADVSPYRLIAPGGPGVYEVVLAHPDSGQILARHLLEVR